jgi:DNA-binding response OmpR family regulator
MPKSILLVDDDTLLRRGLGFNLEESGYRVFTASNAEDALISIQRDMPDLVLLDIGLPGMDGLEAIQKFKALGIPVIFLTARRRKIDEVLGLEIGAEDFITKPYDLDVLLARVKAVLRRIGEKKENTLTMTPIELGDLTIHPASHTVTVRNRIVNLSPREFDLLLALAMQPDCVISIDDLINRVWGAEFVGQAQVVYVHIHWLRGKLESAQAQLVRIDTVRQAGYKLTVQV